MSSNWDGELNARLYLLGALSDPDSENFEQQLLTAEGFYDELLAAENELVDDYLARRLRKDEQQMFERHFLNSPERAQKLRFAKALQRYAAEHTGASTVLSKPVPGRWSNFFASPLRTLAVAAVVLLAVAGVWRIFFYTPDIDKGLVALNNAYKQQRPFESRITNFDYAPYIETRGAETERVNSSERDAAERYLLDAVRDKPNSASYHALGNLYLARKDFDKAIHQFEAAIKADPNNSAAFADLGTAWLEKGKRDQLTGNDQADIELARGHENFTKALTLNPKLAEAWFNRAISRQYLKLMDQAAADWREYLKLDSTSPWANEARQSLQKLEARPGALGSEEQVRRDFLLAYQNRDDERAWTAFKQGRTRGGNGVVNGLLIDYLNFTANGQANSANESLQQLKYAGELETRKINDHFTADLAAFYSSTNANLFVLLEAQHLMRTAIELYNHAEFDSAASTFSQAKEKFDSAHDEGESLLAEFWVDCCELRTLSPEVLSNFGRIARLLQSKNYAALEAQAVQAQGDAQSSLAKFSQVLATGNEALKLSQRIQDEPNEIRSLTLLLSTHLALGEYQESLELFRRAAHVGEGAPRDPKLMWPIYYEAGLDFHLLDLPATALSFENEALALANAAKVPLLRSRSFERLGTLNCEQKNYDEAVRNGQQAVNEAENIVSERSRISTRAHAMLRLGRFYSEAGDATKGLAHYDQSLALYKRLDSQLYVYEASKGKLLAHLAMQANDSVRAELPGVIQLFEKNRAGIEEESHRDKFFDAGQDTYDIAVKFSSSEPNGTETALNYAEASRARSLFEMINAGWLVADVEGPELKLDAESQPLVVSQIQQRMPEAAQILEYSVLDDRIVMWLITRSAIRSKQVAVGAPQLLDRVRSYVTAIAEPSTSTLDSIVEQSKELHSLLIAPVKNYLDPNRVLCIVPDKSLNFVPFEALASATSGRFLVEDYAVQRAPSATVFVTLSDAARKREKVAHENVLTVGNPAFDHAVFNSLGDLPDAKREAEQIAELYPRATCLAGADATTASVVNALPKAEVLHFATHAVTDERSPLLSKFLLAHKTGDASGSDAVLRAADVYEMKLPRTRLVVLSACQTGIEQAYRGEGAIGLARPFLAAGVPTVVASLWPIDSQVTADLMISFHRFRTEQKLPTVDALRRAQLACLHNSPPEPQKKFGWAAFTVIGGYAAF
ncbi:MAG TPA: CHAT domain-containing protein [Pyrinomonadaceae bacterium]|nr:CHAT domain-containing protein [Pyrinomonadaceae bacterium]